MTKTIDHREIDQFNRHAKEWWDGQGVFKPLHEMNPCRLQYIKQALCKHFNKDPKAPHPLEGLTLLDAGCGGGLLTEPLARLGATVTGIDAGDKNIEVAKQHAADQGLDITYQVATPNDLTDKFDAVISLEVVEHVADIPAYIQDCTNLVGPQGALIMSTLNRTPLSYVGAIALGEYVLRWVPKGTHDWHKFVKPAELATFLESQGFKIDDLKGMVYKPLSKEWHLSDNVNVNYIITSFSTKA